MRLSALFIIAVTANALNLRPRPLFNPSSIREKRLHKRHLSNLVWRMDGRTNNQSFASISMQFEVIKPSMPVKADNHSTDDAPEWVGFIDDRGFANTTAGVICRLVL
jgi:hypothetical protein